MSKAPTKATSTGEGGTHVQYTQTDTIRPTDSPLVPMVRLVLVIEGVK